MKIETGQVSTIHPWVDLPPPLQHPHLHLPPLHPEKGENSGNPSYPTVLCTYLFIQLFPLCHTQE